MSMRDTLTPSNPRTTDVLSAQLEAFRRNPTDGALFHELRAELRKSGQAEPLADIGELHAPHERDRLRAAEIWSEAGEARLVLGHEQQGEADLRRALELDPANERAAARLTELLLTAERFAEAAEVLEVEIEELERRAGASSDSASLNARRGQRHRTLAQLWDERLGRVDLALQHWQCAWQLDPECGDALEAARNIYTSLGDDAMVARLYEAEIAALAADAPAERRARLEHQLGRILHRQGRAADAAERLERALELAPRSPQIREALAEVYASNELVGDEQHQHRASELFVELGRHRLSTQQGEAAIVYLRRALGVDPYSQEGSAALEGALAAEERWDELERLYRHRSSLAADPGERRAITHKRAELYERQLGDRDALKTALAELVAEEAPGGDSAARLRDLYRQDQDWALLAGLIERELPAVEHDRARLCAELLELATIAREHLSDRDRAAELLHRVLTIDSRNAEALARYGEHFRERRDWRGLADLLEFALDNAREDGATAEELVRQLEDLAKLAELRLGDVERAINAWRRIQELEPDNRKAGEALRRLMSQAKMYESLVGMLEGEAERAQSPVERAEALRRIAQVYRERQVNPRRAIALYEEVLGLFPRDEAVLKALSELYEREGDDAGLAHTLRRQLDLDLEKMQAEVDGTRAMTARDWPVAKRSQRLTALRRLASMYEDRLDDPEGVVYACTGILELMPGDRDALDRMERVLDKAGDAERLEQTLEYHASSATGPAERAKVLRRLARLAADQGDEVKAMERWETTLKAAPSDAEALEALGALYEAHQRWGELATVLERQHASQKLPTPGSAAAALAAVELKRYAHVVDAELGDTPRALRAWQRVLEVQPRDRQALDALTRLYETAGRWRDLAEILATQAPLYVDDEPQKAAAVGLRRARLLEERLGAPAEAAKALEALLSDLDPANLDAHKALRRLYEARGDFDAAVRIAEREMYLATEPSEKIARGLEIGLLCRDRLSDPKRALQAFERVLELSEGHEEAITAAAELYARVGDWGKHIELLERRIERLDSPRARRGLMLRIAQVSAERLEDPEAAFGWYRAAHEAAPDATTIGELRRAAEAFGLWRELAEVYRAERDRLREGELSPQSEGAYVAASRELAAIIEHRLGNRADAMTVLRQALEVRPLDDVLRAECERIALEADEPELWKELLQCLDVPLATADAATRVSLHRRRARILEERLADGQGAIEELLHAFSWAPERDETRLALYDLAENTGNWAEVVSVESALLLRAPTTGRRIEALRRRAHVIEEHLADSVRAFRTHLVAFLLAPQDSETVAHLWRLARQIDRYREADKTPRPEPAPAFVQSPAAITAINRAAMRPSKRHSRLATQELSVDDLLPNSMRPPSADFVDDDAEDAEWSQRKLGVGDSTMPIDVGDLEDIVEVESGAQKPHRDDPTIELRTEDLIGALGARRSSGRPGLPGLTPRDNAPPPPPKKALKRVSPPPAPAPLPLLQTLPVRPYQSPWEELATGYERLPASTADGKLRWIFRAAEVWETGAGEIGRAFDTLSLALELCEGDDAEPRARLHRLAAAHDAWDRLAALYENAAEEARTGEAAVNLLMEVGEIRARQGRDAETEATYRRILGMRPDDAVARERLEALYRRADRWVDLAASLEERTDPRLGTAAPEPERPALLRELAAMYRDRLGRPHDAIDALNRLRQLAPEDIELLRELAELYATIGRWSKVITMLGRIAEIADGGEAKSALRRIAEIYERELELPDRAIEAYTQLVSSWPDDTDAYAALDSLYQSHGRWHELSEILRRRAGLARDPQERSRLLRRRAQVLLEWLDAPEEAAAALRHARTITPDDVELAGELVAALIAAHREREAAAVLEARIASLDDSGGRGDKAALLIRLANLRAEHLADADGARRALEQALEEVPEHPTALTTLARLAENQEDPRAFAEAKLREADALTDVDARVEALMAAGIALRDRVADADAARAAFAKVIELRPYHSRATWALAGLVEQGGDLETATRLLEARLEDPAVEAEERALILTQLAALARHAGVAAVAERRLDEALAVAPSHLPAVLALSDMLTEAGRQSDLEEFLLETIPKLEDAPPAALAELHRRLAAVYETLGRSDDAYQTLLSADRLHRNHLLVKLALGENRYRARRWREAALHLATLADHPDAGKFPAEVAEGLYHAALAEIRSLRPEKAGALYERAVELKPNYTPALHALAEQAMERGDHRRAADLLTRQATATDEPGERMRLFEALGDMALMTLHDEDRARVCFEAAVQAASPLESQHLPLLEKLLERQDLAGDHAGAARTAELMASFGSDESARAARYTAAAESYAAAGDSTRARLAAERAVEAHPYDLTAVTVLANLLLEEADHEAAAAILGRALSGSDDADDELTRARKAQLWVRLGQARLERGDVGGASSALEKAVFLAPDSDGAMQARRHLVEVWKDEPKRAEAVIDYRRELAADSLELADVLAYARMLRRAGHGDGGRAMLEVATTLGHTLDVHDSAFLADHPAAHLAEDEAYRGTLDEELRAALIADRDEQPLGELLAMLWQAAPLLWTEAEEALERCGVVGATRVTAKSAAPAINIFPRVAAALGLGATLLYHTELPDAPDVQVVCVAPPIIVLGPRLTAASERPSDAQLRFLLGRAAEMARPERVIAMGLPEEDFINLLASLVRCFGPPGLAASIGSGIDDRDVMRAHDALLRTTLPVKLRTRLEQLLAHRRAGDLSAERFFAAADRAADRAGLLVCGDFATATAHAGATSAEGRRLTRHLVQTALSRAYLPARARLGVGVRSA